MSKSHLCFLLSSLNFAASPTSVDAPTMQALKSSLNLSKDVDWSNPNPCKWPTVQCDTSNRARESNSKPKESEEPSLRNSKPPHRANCPGAFPEPNLRSDPRSLRFNSVTVPEPPRQPLRLCPQEQPFLSLGDDHGQAEDRVSHPHLPQV
ncbi:hypothetical protein F2Q70_00014959 [Brassica cretica]|uniref:Leucine-rich repeat-containing N-terminal plant-type domain-containing protein n=1 Tax=Brassica cretica TaxID=69181 RepID=A0A8S9HUL0_BRACR|nr:hypothetical protein F2Q70_00014959 [Brassica cretica]